MQANQYSNVHTNIIEESRKDFFYKDGLQESQ
jgi:hypothetical protein